MINPTYKNWGKELLKNKAKNKYTIQTSQRTDIKNVNQPSILSLLTDIKTRGTYRPVSHLTNIWSLPTAKRNTGLCEYKDE